MKIALLQCPVWGTYDPPLALAQLAGCLKQRGVQVIVLDINIDLYRKRKHNYQNTWAWEQSDLWYSLGYVHKFFQDNASQIDTYLQRILAEDVQLVGFSLNNASRLASIEFAKKLKQLRSQITIVFGGPLFLNKNFVQEVLKEDCVDIVIPGEGERAFLELISCLEQESDLADSAGLVFRKNNHLVHTQPSELINLDSLPFLDFTDLPLNNYDDLEHIPFMASRGCIRRCAFCSDSPCWPGYRAMSGERIFNEVAYHKSRFKDSLGHVDFMDLVFNGNIASLEKFCDLMARAQLQVYWTANMTVRPEMTEGIIRKMKPAGCEHIIFGIESGSQRVLNLMRKYYDLEDAQRIIKSIHKQGIIVTANFMFGFPGETEADFALSLEFIKRNAAYLDRVYPSRTYCALEEFSYFHAQPDEFGIRPNPPNHLYWESLDGKNTYPVRLERCERFCTLATSLGIEVGSGVQTSTELDKWYNLAFYYEACKDYQQALNCFLKYQQLDPANEIICSKVNYCRQQLGQDNSARISQKTILVDTESR